MVPTNWGTSPTFRWVKRYLLKIFWDGAFDIKHKLKCILWLSHHELNKQIRRHMKQYPWSPLNCNIFLRYWIELSRQLWGTSFNTFEFLSPWKWNRVGSPKLGPRAKHVPVYSILPLPWLLMNGWCQDISSHGIDLVLTEHSKLSTWSDKIFWTLSGNEKAPSQHEFVYWHGVFNITHQLCW